MSDKVVIEGMLSSWRYGPEFVGISINGQTVEGDWATVSGRRVRVMVEVIEAEPTDRLAGCKCKECGGPLCVHNHTEHHTYVEYPYAVWCNHCGKPVGPHDTTAAAAIDAYLAYLARLAQQKPEPRCPFCGGEIEETPFYHFDGDRMYAVSQTAKCLQCGAHGEGKTRQAALDALAEWLKPCPRCGGKAEYKGGHVWGNDVWYVKCSSEDCGIESTRVFSTKPAAAQWWNKRSKA